MMRTGSLALAFVAAALAAYWLGRHHAEQGTRATAAPSVSTVADMKRPKPSAPASVPGRTSADAYDEPSPLPQTLAEIHDIRGDFGQTAALYELAARADEATLVRLIEEALAIEQLSERKAASSILYGRYGDLDPIAAVNHALEHAGSVAEEAIGTIFYSWSRVDLEAAKSRIETLSTPLARIAAIATLRARDDLDETERRRLAADLSAEPFLQGMLASEAAQRWATDPKAGWDAALAMTDREGRPQQLMMIATRWSRTDPDAALEAIRELPDDGVRTMLVQSVLSVVAQEDPERALAEVGDGFSKSERNQLTTMVVSSWAVNDPRAAIAWLDEQRDTSLRKQLIPSIAPMFAMKSLQDAVQWAAELSAEERTLAMPMVAQALLPTDPDRAARLVLELNDQQAVVQLASVWVQMDPPAACAWIASHIDDAPTRAMLFESAITPWADTDEPGAIRFVESLDAGTEYDRAAVAAIRSMSKESEAARLIDKIRDPSMKALARNVMEERRF